MRYQMLLHRDNIEKFIEITDSMGITGFSSKIKHSFDDNCFVVYIHSDNQRGWNLAEHWGDDDYDDHKAITWKEFLEMFDEKQTKEFKVGDKVYVTSTSEILTVDGVVNNTLSLDSHTYSFHEHKNNCCHATQENYEMLSKLFPNVNYEPPKQYLQGSKLCRKKLKDGEQLIVCYVSNTSDEMSVEIKTTAIVVGENGSGQFITMSGGKFNNAVPLANKDEILREEITHEQ